MAISVVKSTAKNIEDDPYYRDRCNLAAVFRWTARLEMHEGVANHYSYAVSEDGTKFLVNPNGRHFASVRASELLLLDANNKETLNQPNAPDPTAWFIHGALHRNVPHAKCILHAHPKYSTILASLEDSNLPPIDQNSMRFFNRMTVDDGFDGMGLGDEAERLSTTVGDNPIVLMGNHGISALSQNIALAFDVLYYFERACRNYVAALMTGTPLRIASDAVAQKTADQWKIMEQGLADAHLREIKEILDREEPDYKQ